MSSTCLDSWCYPRPPLDSWQRHPHHHDQPVSQCACACAPSARPSPSRSGSPAPTAIMTCTTSTTTFYARSLPCERILVEALRQSETRDQHARKSPTQPFAHVHLSPCCAVLWRPRPPTPHPHAHAAPAPTLKIAIFPLFASCPVARLPHPPPVRTRTRNPLQLRHQTRITLTPICHAAMFVFVSCTSQDMPAL